MSITRRHAAPVPDPRLGDPIASGTTIQRTGQLLIHWSDTGSGGANHAVFNNDHMIASGHREGTGSWIDAQMTVVPVLRGDVIKVKDLDTGNEVQSTDYNDGSGVIQKRHVCGGLHLYIYLLNNR